MWLSDNTLGGKDKQGQCHAGNFRRADISLASIFNPCSDVCAPIYQALQKTGMNSRPISEERTEVKILTDMTNVT